MTEIGGLCGLLSRRRRQPSGGGAHAEPVFPTKGEAATEGGRRRHTMAVEALVPPDATRKCNSVHKWSETAPRGYFSQSVYTPLPPGAS